MQPAWTNNGDMEKSIPHNLDGPVVCRVSSAAIHLGRYSFRGLSVLARDAGLSASTISRLVNGNANPSYRLVIQLTEAIERQVGHHIDPRDIVAINGRFLTPYICDVMHCRGCLPECARDEFGERAEKYKDIHSGQWVMEQYPKGYPVGKLRHGK